MKNALIVILALGSITTFAQVSCVANCYLEYRGSGERKDQVIVSSKQAFNEAIQDIASKCQGLKKTDKDTAVIYTSRSTEDRYNRSVAFDFDINKACR